MATFAEIQALVEAQTRRPEIPDITKAAIRTAVLRAHHTDFFPRDLVEGPLSYVASSQTFVDFPSVSASLLRLREIKFVQMLDAITSVPVEQLEYRQNDDLYDSDGNRRPHVYTLVGDTLRIYPSRNTGNVSVFYFQNPDVSEAQFSSWIADLYPDDIAYWAAAIVFARSGFAEQAQQMHEVYVKSFKEILVASHLLGNVS